MVTDPNYQPRTLLAPFEQGPVVPSFLRDTFFRAREYPPTNIIEFDFRRGRRKMAPFVAPLVGGKVMERAGFETRLFTAPRIAPIRNLRIPDLEPRMFGENVYSGRTAADRAATLLAEDTVFCDEAISRREEWMCRELIVNGSITVIADHGYTSFINFMESSVGATNNHFVPTTKWDQQGSDPIEDLDAARLLTIRDSGIQPNVALFGALAKKTFISNATVKELLDKQRFEIATIRPVIQSPSVTLFGSVPGLQLYQYTEYFEDDAGQIFSMLPDDFVFLASTNQQNRIVYGAFTQLEDAKTKRYVTYQTSRIPFVYGDEANGNLFYRLTAQPLPMPTDVLGWRIIEALTQGPTAPARKLPYFAPTGETVQTQHTQHAGGTAAVEEGELDEHTVPELRDIAEAEGAEISSGDNKADIIKAIKKNRKSKEK